MKDLAILLRKPPYGSIVAAEALRHALGAALGEMNVTLLLIGAGVQAARKGQDATGAGLINLGDSLSDCIDSGVEVYADKASMDAEVLDEQDILHGVKVVNGWKVAELMKNAKGLMIF